MAGNRFVLRNENDTENPILARFYGDGITASKIVLYAQQGNRTAFIGLIAQGARFPGDTGCASVRRVYYAGFEIPEFDTNDQRNWKFHKGLQSKHPVYHICTFANSGDKINQNAHPYSNGDKVAFHRRGETGELPFDDLKLHHQYFVVNKTTNDFQISLTEGGSAIVFDENSSGVWFSYLAEDVGFFDEAQGRPEFFPNLDFTFSGKAYIEVLLPPELSNGEDEPTRMKFVCRGKEVYDLIIGDDDLLEETGDPIDNENPALVAYDMLKKDLLCESSRFHAPSWIEYKERSDEMILWEGGNQNPTSPSSFDVIIQGLYNPTTATLAKLDGARCEAYTDAFSERNALIEGVYNGGEISLIFNTAQTQSAQIAGIIITATKTIYFTDGTNVHVLGNANISDRFRIAFEEGSFQCYRNSIPLSLTGIEVPIQPAGDFYAMLNIETDDKIISDIKIQPSGTPTTPREVKRFYGDLATADILPVISGFEGIIALTPGVSWQDVDGEIKILPRPDREPVFTFIYDPAHPEIASNTSYVKIKKRFLDETPNFWRWSYRNKDDFILLRNFTSTDRPALRALAKKKIEVGGIIPFGVLTPSQMDRIGESTARVTADCDFGFDIEGFFDSLIVAKGDFVWVVDPVGGFTYESPCKCVILSENLEYSEEYIETRSFDTQVITDDFYSDTAHGQVVPVTSTTATDRFTPAPFIISIELDEDSRRLPDGTYIPTIEGIANFAPVFNQTGKVYRKSFLGNGNILTPDHTTNTFTYSGILSLEDDDEISVATIGAMDALPNGLDWNKKYFLKSKNEENKTFKISLTEGGADFDFTSNGSGDIRIFAFAPWQFTNEVITPDPATLESPFELENIQKGLHFIRVVSISSGGISADFNSATFSKIFINGDILIPAPPPFAQYIYDGVTIRFEWLASPSPNVAGYIVKDEFETILYQGDARSFVIPARVSAFSVRIFAYSHSSVVSSGYATVNFNPAPISSLMNISGATIEPNGSLRKTASTAWGNCGAILNQMILTNEIPIRIALPLDNLTEFRIFGITRDANCNSYEDFDRAVYIHDDGNIYAIWKDSGGVTQTVLVAIGEIGQKYALRITPPIDIGELSQIDIIHIVQVGSEFIELEVYTFEELNIKLPQYIGISLYSIGSSFPPSLEVSASLMPVIQTIPTIQNAANVNYNSGTGTALSTGAGGFSSGNTIPAGVDGQFEFSVHSNDVVTVGLQTTDSDTNPLNIPFAIRKEDDFNTDIYLNGVFDENIGNINDVSIFQFGRENGIPTLRVDGVIKKQWTSAPSELKNNTIRLDCSMSNSDCEITTIRLRVAHSSFQDDSGSRSPISAILRQSQLGKNKVYDIPEMDFSSPTNGQVPVFLNGKLVNATLINTPEIGVDIIGGSPNKILYIDTDGELAQSDKILFDGDDLKLVNPVSATIGAQKLKSPHIYLNGKNWRVDTSVSESSLVRILGKASVTQYNHVPASQFSVENWSPAAGDWVESFTVRAKPSNYLNLEMILRNPSVGAWGGIIEADHQGAFTFRSLTGDLSPMTFNKAGASPATFPTFAVTYSGYRPELRAYFGATIIIGAGYPASVDGLYAEGNASTGDESLESQLSTVIKNNKIDRDALRVIGANGQTAPIVEIETYANSKILKIFEDRVSAEKSLERKVNSTAVYSKVGGIIHDFTSRISVDLDEVEIELASYSIPANLLANNGDKVEIEFYGATGSSGANAELYFDLLGTRRLTSAFSSGEAGWIITAKIMRVDSDSLRLMVKCEVSGVLPVIQTMQIDSVNFSSTIDFDIIGLTFTADDLEGDFGTIKFMPKA